jgi:hypothetical protein
MFGFGNDKQSYMWQLLLHDDHSFEFVKREVIDTCLVETKGNGDEKEFLRGWLHLHVNQYAFAGCQGVPPGLVTISTERDILEDVFGVVPAVELPGGKIDKSRNGKGPNPVTQWLGTIVDARVSKMAGNRGKSQSMDKVITTLAIMNVAGVLGLIIQILMSRAV